MVVGNFFATLKHTHEGPAQPMAAVEERGPVCEDIAHLDLPWQSSAMYTSTRVLDPIMTVSEPTWD
ncbi:hypothetical protein EWB00_001794 [Schistosoma japonicum]|uniref:Uncharacterized protein n=1 Tax=Schistosoma japonicum TaxID=6182 RepID=A0A4Z2CK31_SCHJA|nr:hypothetical protein EWB00_001794 [Schistosoma japonicum]